MSLFPRSYQLLAALIGCLIFGFAHADEGMWTFDGFPSQKVADDYHF